MKKNGLRGLTCTEAANICNKAEYKEASLHEKLKLKMHLFFCRTCNEYNRRNRGLSQLLKKAKLRTCSPEEKAAYKKRMEEAKSDGSEKP